MPSIALIVLLGMFINGEALRAPTNSSTATPAIAVSSFKENRWSVVLRRSSRAKYEDISFPTSRMGWVTTATGEILHTADGGRSWKTQRDGLGIVRSVDFIDESTGFAGTLSGELYVTRNAGKTWTEIAMTLPHPAKGFCGITHVGQEVHMVGRYYGASDYYYSPDSGRSWRHTDLRSMAQGLVDVAFVSQKVGFIGGMARSKGDNDGVAIILRTDNGGRSWKPVYVHDGGRGFVWKLWPVSSDIIYAALQSQDGIYRVAKSTDGGNRWETLIVATDRQSGFGIQGIGFIDSNRGWVGGFFRGMYSTEDGGRTWTFVDSPDYLINRFEQVGNVMYTGSTRGLLRYEAR